MAKKGVHLSMTKMNFIWRFGHFLPFWRSEEERGSQKLRKIALRDCD